MKKPLILVYDIETIKGIFTYCGIDINTKQVYKFIIHPSLNQAADLYNHLVNEVKGQIGYNNLAFDYPVLHYFIINYPKWLEEIIYSSDNFALFLIEKLYNKAQEIIEIQNSKNRDWAKILWEKDFLIPQLDLFKVWHYDNVARMTSLKALEISMNYANVMDMPIEHTEENITIDQIEEILQYNLNDVMATYEFYLKTILFGKVDLRKKIKQKYNLPCTNWNNGKIGENLILKLYCDKIGANTWDIKKMRSEYSEIALNDCIPKNILFESKEFNTLLEFYKGKIITDPKNLKGAVDYPLVYKGIKYQYGLGGLHAAIESGIYKSNDKYIIKTADVTSLYPNIPLEERFYIKHLGPEFLEVYGDDIVNVRSAEKLKPKEERDATIVDGYKEAANIPYGKSNDINSFLYDPMYTLKTTLAGQLFISMLCEALCKIPDSQMLMVNTDGMEIIIPREHEKLYKDICSTWEKRTGLNLEFDEYNQMIIGDINNYIAETVSGKVKNKGRFEVDKVIGSEPAYHKDNSFRIIPLALQEFFINDTSIEYTIKNHFLNSYKSNENHGIYDFCGRQKFKGKDYGEIHFLEDGINHKIEKQQKNTRYYISTNGATFIKQYAKGSQEFIHVGNKVTIFNKFIEKSSEDYSINYQWYIREANKEIRNIIKEQLKLFN